MYLDYENKFQFKNTILTTLSAVKCTMFTYLHGLFSPGNLQHNSQAFVGGS